MQCPKCKNEILIKLGSKLIIKGGQALTGMTTIITIKCEKCGHVFQIPLSSNSFISVKKQDNK